ncbi:MAG: McrC family protein [Spirochaetes bacterium]|nr:McrC family protein [Bacteroidales bacterium]MBN2772176.1 McrC family protein [Spirochaetota bacterium]
MSAKRHISCVEHEIISNGFIDYKAYKELYAFSLTDAAKGIISPGPNCLKLKSYVGIIQTASGFVLEILPKIHNENNNVEESRDTYLKMLKTIRYLPGYKDLDTAHLKTDSKMPLFELFISMFINEVFTIVKKGIKSDYVAEEYNSTFLRGKLVVGGHIKQNIAHKERFYISHDNYIPDIPHNRILKSAILYLQEKSIAVFFENKRRLRELSFIFDEVYVSRDYKQDYAQCKRNRTNSYYNKALAWALVFLGDNSFSTFSGSTVACSLLFPMEKIFERYVYELLAKNGELSIESKNSDKSDNNLLKKEVILNSITELRYQKPQKYLLKETFTGKDRFLAKPDITCWCGDIFYIIDAKWKLLDQNSLDGKCGISQADLYQLLSYAMVIPEDECKDVQLVLVYPKHTGLNTMKNFSFNITGERNVNITIFPLALPGCNE